MMWDKQMLKPIVKDAFWAVFIFLLIGAWFGYGLLLVYPIATPIEAFHLRKLFIMVLKKDIAFTEALQAQGATLEDIRCGYIPVNSFAIEIYIKGKVDVPEIQQKLRKIISQDMNGYFPSQYKYDVDIYTQYSSEYDEPAGHIQYSPSLAHRLLVLFKQLKLELAMSFVAIAAFFLASKFVIRKKGLGSFFKRHMLLCLVVLIIGIVIGINIYKCGIRSPEADSIQKLICFVINNDETVKTALQAYNSQVISVTSSFSPINKFVFKIHLTEHVDKNIVSSTVRATLQRNYIVDYFFSNRYELFFEIVTLPKNNAQVSNFEKERR